MSTRTKVLLIGVALTLLGAGFDSVPVMAVGIVLVLAGIIMFIGRKL